MAHLVIVDSGQPTERKKVVYEVRTLDGSRKRKSKTFKPNAKMKDIKAFMRKVEMEYESSEGIDYSKRTVSMFLDEYFELYGERHLSPTTLKRYRNMANSKVHGVKKYLGDIELRKLTTRHVQQYANALEDDGLSGKTIKNYVMFIHAVYDRAMKLRYVPMNYNIVSNVETPKIRKRKVDAYSYEEVQDLLARVDQEPNYLFRLQMYTLIFTGCRRSEANAIRYSDIDFENKILHVTKARVTADGGDVEKEPKTDSSIRDIPLPDILIKMLKSAHREYLRNKLKYGEGFQDDGYVFSNPDGSPQATNEMSVRWSRFTKKHPDLRYLPLHSAGRHTCASLLISQGVNPRTVQTILGHADVSTTLNTYTSSYKEDEIKGIQKLETLIFAKEA